MGACAAVAASGALLSEGSERERDTGSLATEQASNAATTAIKPILKVHIPSAAPGGVFRIRRKNSLDVNRQSVPKNTRRVQERQH